MRTVTSNVNLDLKVTLIATLYRVLITHYSDGITRNAQLLVSFSWYYNFFPNKCTEKERKK